MVQVYLNRKGRAVGEQIDKPGRLLDREHEWALLNDFLADPAAELRLAIVLGAPEKREVVPARGTR
jgi:hypothetical protein